MKAFNESAMIAGLLEREADAKFMCRLFKPEWLKSAELKPILRAIDDYMKDKKYNNRSPDLQSLHEYMKEKDPALYNARYRATLDQLRMVSDKLKLKAIADAKDTAATYALSYLLSEQRFQHMLTEGDAEGCRKELQHWLTQHTESDDEGLYTIQEAFDLLLKEYPWQGRDARVKTGIRAIDEWAGGIRAAELGVIVAPTGNGKSAALMNIARYTAAVEGKRTLFITNELTRNQQAERFMVRMQEPKKDGNGNYIKDANGEYIWTSLAEVQEDPTVAYKKMKGTLGQVMKNLYIFSAGLNQTAGDVDQLCQEIRHLHGAYPEVVVIDYMERMDTMVDVDREKTWLFYGQLAKELIWLGKRRNVVVWTAAQTNRSGLARDVVLGLDMLQGSVQHAQEATYAITMQKKQVQTPAGKEVTALEFGEQKSRFGKMEYRTMLLKADLGRMYISDEEVESMQAIEAAQDQMLKTEEKRQAREKKKQKLNTNEASNIPGYAGKK